MSAHDHYSGRPVSLAFKADDPDMGVVSDYVSRLNDAYKDEESFMAIVGELESLGRAELFAIAEEMWPGRPTSRSAAIEQIMRPMEIYRDNAIRSGFMRGRSAS
jgi:hypothetical protein